MTNQRSIIFPNTGPRYWEVSEVTITDNVARNADGWVLPPKFMRTHVALFTSAEVSATCRAYWHEQPERINTSPGGI
jgi:hypothetical protein